MSDLFSLLTHELRGALSMIAVAARMLEKEGHSLSKREQELLTLIRNNVQAVEVAAQNIIGAAEVEAGEFRLRKQDVEVGGELQYVVQRYRSLGQDKGIVVEAQPLDFLGVVEADRDWMLLVMSNLLQSSLKSSGSGGRIVLGADLAGHNVRIFVKRTLSKTPRARDERDGSLMLAQRLAEVHNTRIEQETADGQMSHFFSLPLASSALAANE